MDIEFSSIVPTELKIKIELNNKTSAKIRQSCAESWSRAPKPSESKTI